MYAQTLDDRKNLSSFWGMVAIHGRMLEHIRFFGHYATQPNPEVMKAIMKQREPLIKGGIRLRNLLEDYSTVRMAFNLFLQPMKLIPTGPSYGQQQGEMHSKIESRNLIMSQQHSEGAQEVFFGCGLRRGIPPYSCWEFLSG